MALAAEKRTAVILSIATGRAVHGSMFLQDVEVLGWPWAVTVFMIGFGSGLHEMTQPHAVKSLRRTGAETLSSAEPISCICLKRPTR